MREKGEALFPFSMCFVLHYVQSTWLLYMYTAKHEIVHFMRNNYSKVLPSKDPCCTTANSKLVFVLQKRS